MNNSQLALAARLGLAGGIGLFTFAFVTSAVGNIRDGSVSASVGAFAGMLTFAGGALIAFRSAREDGDRPPPTGREVQGHQLLGEERRAEASYREPLLTDALMILAGPRFIAVGYLKLIENNIPYPPGDYRLTQGYHELMFVLGLIIGVFLSVLGSIRLAFGLRRRRRRR